jgi:hypothetical protein
MFSAIRWRFTAAFAAGLVLVAVHAFQWTIVDRITVFLYSPLIIAVWWVVVGAGFASLTCLTKVRTIGVRALAPTAVIVLSVLIVTFAPFTSLWLDFDYWLYMEERLEIVERVAGGELEPNVEHNAKLIGLGDSYPLVSTGGNEIVVEEHEGKKYVLFFTFRGVLDNYSGFLYVPSGGSPSLFSDLNEEFAQIKLLEENWYLVSHR